MRSRWGIAAALVAVVAAVEAVGACAGPPPPPPAPAPPAPPRADLVLVGGQVHTLDPQAPRAQSVAIKGNRIVAVGAADALRSWVGPETRQIDLANRVVIPGLVDSHLHLFGVGKQRLELNLVGTTSLKDVLAKVRAAAESAPAGQWIRGRGWDQNDWSDHRGFPTAIDLDAVAPGHPVVLTRIDGHAIWVNSEAMRRASVTRDTRSPSGGRVVKRRGRPTGIFVDNASSLIEGHVPPYSPDELAQVILQAQQECLEAGLTQVHEMGIGPAELAALQKLDDSGALRLRVYAMLDGGMEDLTPYMRAGPQIASDGRRLTVRGLKFYMDGALGSRGAALLTPYSDARKQRGLLLMAPSLLEARVATAKQHGFQVAIHAIGDRANREVLDILERVYGKDDGTHRPRIEHAQVVSTDDLSRFSALNVIASMQPTHATSDMPWAEKRVGPQRIQGAYAWRTLVESGAVLAAGSDAPVEDVSPLIGLYAAITRKDLEGSPDDGWYPAERLSPAQALAAFTSAGAYASFREQDAGQIAVGRIADLTVIDKDPLTAAESDLASMQAVLTIVGGRLEFAKPGADRPPSTSTSSVAAR